MEKEGRWKRPSCNSIVVVVSAKVETSLGRFQQFADAPHMVRDSSGHSRGYAERFVDAAKVVKCKPAGHSGPMVLPLLTERVSQASEAACAHANGEVLAFDNRSANALGVRLTHDWDYLHGLDFGGAVSRFAFLRSAVNLDELCKVAAILQGVEDRGAVRSKAVSRDLESLAGSRVAQAFDENVRGGLVALTHGDVQHELGMPLDSNEGVAVAKVGIVLGPNTLFFFLNEGPQLIALNIASGNVADLLSHDALALLASEDQEFQNRGVVNFSEALHTRNAVAFEQEFQNHFGLLDGQVHSVKRIVSRLREGLAALTALVSRKLVSRLSELAAFGSAVVARHLDLELSSRPCHAGRGPQKSRPLSHDLGLLPLIGANYQREESSSLQRQSPSSCNSVVDRSTRKRITRLHVLSLRKPAERGVEYTQRILAVDVDTNIFQTITNLRHRHEVEGLTKNLQTDRRQGIRYWRNRLRGGCLQVRDRLFQLLNTGNNGLVLLGNRLLLLAERFNFLLSVNQCLLVRIPVEVSHE